MAQTKAGAAKAKAKLIEKLGSEEAYKRYMAERGRTGGRNSSEGGWRYMARTNPELLRELSKKGGSISKRKKKVQE